MMSALARLALVVVLWPWMVAPAVGEAAALQPFQMVRSLQLVQDRIALGDHAALPMQRKLLDMIDKRFREASVEELEREANFRGLLVYGMSGGNPATLETAMSKLLAENRDRRLADGVLSYLRGRPQAAQAALADVAPLAFDPELGAFLALIKGSLAAREEPETALPLLDQARLLAPGTLVEEAALRRAILIHGTLLDAKNFLMASHDYVRRYLRSPYASQFADAFVSGVIALHASVPLAQVEAVAALMEPEQERVIYLRIARRAAIEGLKPLSNFASAKAESLAVEGGGPSDPRAALYASLSSVASDAAGDLSARLEGIDRAQLSEGDRRLLDAAEAVVREINAKPDAQSYAAAPAPVNSPHEPENASPEEASAPGPEAIPAQAEPATPEPPDPADETISRTRRALDEVDALLKTAAQ